MAALTADRNTPRRDSKQFSYPVAASTTIYAGSLVALDASGNAVPGTVSTTLVAAGRAEQTVDNSAGSAADLSVEVRQGTFRWENGESITKAHIGDPAYIIDDQTVGRTDDTSTRSVAGVIVDVDPDGVWVKTEF